MPECNGSSLSSTAAQGRVLHEKALLLTCGASKVRSCHSSSRKKRHGNLRHGAFSLTDRYEVSTDSI
jgi:hypothetical protein